VRHYLQPIRILECEVEGLVLLSQVSHTYKLNHMGLSLMLRLLPVSCLSPPLRTCCHSLQLARNPIAGRKWLCIEEISIDAPVRTLMEAQRILHLHLLDPPIVEGSLRARQLESETADIINVINRLHLSHYWIQTAPGQLCKAASNRQNFSMRRGGTYHPR